MIVTSSDSLSGVVSSVLVTSKVEVSVPGLAEAATRKTRSPDWLESSVMPPRSHSRSVPEIEQPPLKVVDWYSRGLPESGSTRRTLVASSPVPVAVFSTVTEKVRSSVEPATIDAGETVRSVISRTATAATGAAEPNQAVAARVQAANNGPWHAIGLRSERGRFLIQPLSSVGSTGSANR